MKIPKVHFALIAQVNAVAYKLCNGWTGGNYTLAVESVTCHNCVRILAAKRTNCPKRYGHYDVASNDCYICQKGYLYQPCRRCNQRNACAGWNSKNGEPTCCLCS